MIPQAETNPPAKLLVIAQLNEGAVFLPNLIRLPFCFFLDHFFTFLFFRTSLILCCCQHHFVLVS